MGESQIIVFLETIHRNMVKYHIIVKNKTDLSLCNFRVLIREYFEIGVVEVCFLSSQDQLKWISHYGVGH